jgi:hypothetical protein
MMNTDKEFSTLSVKEAYPSLIQLVIHAETITWNRFYNFLMANSILVLAWATLFASSKADWLTGKVVLSAISLSGAVSGIAWAALSVRGRRFLFDFVSLGQLIEGGETLWPTSLKEVQPLTKAANLRDQQAFRWAGSLFVLVYGALAFTALYSILLVASIGWRSALFFLIPMAVAMTLFCWKLHKEGI